MTEVSVTDLPVEIHDGPNEIPDFLEIKSTESMTLEECNDFWDEYFDKEFDTTEMYGEYCDKNESTDNINYTSKTDSNENIEDPEKTGGRFGDLKNSENTERHHMPADSASDIDRNDGPAIIMDESDHRQTASCGSSKEAREYRDRQRELIEQGKFREALQMDIDDIREKFGDKYDEAIAQMLEYVDQLEKEGKI